MKKDKSKIAIAASLGILVGGTIGVLFAPRSGKETRTMIKNSISDIKKKVSKIDKESIKKYIDIKLDEIENEVAKLEVTTEYKKAKKQGRKVIKKINKLIKYSKKKGIDGFEELVSDLKDMASDITEEILDSTK